MTTQPAAGQWIVFCDGSASPNPGRMGLGILLIAPDGNRQTLSIAPEGRGCNNEAEARAVMAALHELKGLDASSFRLYCDNSVVVEQLMHAPAKPVARLASLFDDVRQVLATFDRPQIVWIPRHRNREADLLARAAIGLAPKPAASIPKTGKSRRRKA